MSKNAKESLKTKHLQIPCVLNELKIQKNPQGQNSFKSFVGVVVVVVSRTNQCTINLQNHKSNFETMALHIYRV